MSPVDRSRHYRGGHGGLGQVSEWTCPSCGEKNTSRFEDGCPQCGTGTAAQVQAAQKPRVGGAYDPDPEHERTLKPQVTERSQVRPDFEAAVLAHERGEGSWTGAQTPAAPLVVTRLIQYVAHPGKDAALRLTLQRSLVGRLEFAWGTITATIVDQVNPRQEDLLAMANRQPGVWLGGPRDMTLPSRPDGEAPGRPFAGTTEEVLDAMTDRSNRQPPAPSTPPAPVAEEPPIVYGVDQATLADAIVRLAGYRGAYTLAMALQAAATAVEAGVDSRVQYDQAECLQLAQALIDRVPEDWEQQGEEAATEADT